MSTEFLTIKECIQSFLKNPDNKNHSFICTVIKTGDLKSGTKDGKDWTKKVYTVEDSTDQLDITTWGGEINLLKVGYKYEITKAYFSSYENKVQVGLRYAQVKVVGSADIENQSTMEQSSKPKETRGEIKTTPLPQFTGAIFVQEQTHILLQIEEQVKKTMKLYMNETEQINGQKVGMFVKTIYEEMKRLTRDKKIVT